MPCPFLIYERDPFDLCAFYYTFYCTSHSSRRILYEQSATFRLSALFVSLWCDYTHIILTYMYRTGSELWRIGIGARIYFPSRNYSQLTKHILFISGHMCFWYTIRVPSPKRSFAYLRVLHIICMYACRSVVVTFINYMY